MRLGIKADFCLPDGGAVVSATSGKSYWVRRANCGAIYIEIVVVGEPATENRGKGEPRGWLKGAGEVEASVEYPEVDGGFCKGGVGEGEGSGCGGACGGIMTACRSKLGV